MAINSRFAITIHILTMLAAVKEPLSSTLMAKSVSANPVTIRKLISVLRHAGLVTTVPGSAGGALLAKNPEEISLCDIYLVVREEDLKLINTHNPSVDCPFGYSMCKLLTSIFSQAERELMASLKNHTIADLHQQVLASYLQDPTPATTSTLIP